MEGELWWEGLLRPHGWAGFQRVSESLEEAKMVPRIGCNLPADKARQTKRLKPYCSSVTVTSNMFSPGFSER